MKVHFKLSEKAVRDRFIEDGTLLHAKDSDYVNASALSEQQREALYDLARGTGIGVDERDLFDPDTGQYIELDRQPKLCTPEGYRDDWPQILQAIYDLTHRQSNVFCPECGAIKVQDDCPDRCCPAGKGDSK